MTARADPTDQKLRQRGQAEDEQNDPQQRE